MTSTAYRTEASCRLWAGNWTRSAHCWTRWSGRACWPRQRARALTRREALFARKPAALTAEERREAIAALLRIGEDSLTPGAINDTLMGCGVRARATEKADRSLEITFPGIIGIPAEFDQIQKIILDILPCHLAVEFFFRYLTWAECETLEYTWEQAEAAEHTWESFQRSVPAEV